MRYVEAVFRSTIIKLRNINSKYQLKIMPNNKIVLFIFPAVFALVLLTCLLITSTPAGFGKQGVANSILKETYTVPSVGLYISLPHGWAGINHENFALVSPAKMNSRTGVLDQKADKVVMTIEVLNRSDYIDIIKHNNILKSNCTTSYNKAVSINGFDGQEILILCGHIKDEKINNYQFTIGNTILIIGLKGSGSTFDDNLEIFKKSVNTLSLTRK
jgi:hypothetical protein